MDAGLPCLGHRAFHVEGRDKVVFVRGALHREEGTLLPSHRAFHLTNKLLLCRRVISLNCMSVMVFILRVPHREEDPPLRSHSVFYLNSTDMELAHKAPLGRGPLLLGRRAQSLVGREKLAPVRTVPPPGGGFPLLGRMMLSLGALPPGRKALHLEVDHRQVCRPRRVQPPGHRARLTEANGRDSGSRRRTARAPFAALPGPRALALAAVRPHALSGPTGVRNAPRRSGRAARDRLSVAEHRREEPQAPR